MRWKKGEVAFCGDENVEEDFCVLLEGDMVDAKGGGTVVVGKGNEKFSVEDMGGKGNEKFYVEDMEEDELGGIFNLSNITCLDTKMRPKLGL